MRKVWASKYVSQLKKTKWHSLESKYCLSCSKIPQLFLEVGSPEIDYLVFVDSLELFFVGRIGVLKAVYQPVKI